jgi:hypothetical protein
LANSGTLVKWKAIAFHDRDRHRRTVNDTDQEIRGIQLTGLDETVFNSMGQIKIHGHSHSPVPFAGRYPFWIATFSDIKAPSLLLPYYRELDYHPIFTIRTATTNTVFGPDYAAADAAP